VLLRDCSFQGQPLATQVRVWTTVLHTHRLSPPLTAAGATVVGKAHMAELAYSLDGNNAHYGTPLNAAAPGRNTGGSSSGSAVS
jgi:hypothetical protein